MKPTAANIEAERKSWRRLGNQFEEDPATIPVEVCDVQPGAICRMWMAPNQSKFVAAGVTKNAEGRQVAVLVASDGHPMNVVPDCWVVVVEETAADVPDLISEIETFTARLQKLAWCGRDSSEA
ncbi:hypothetical protein [Schlesneria sp.]|uniref:hypothetical protein n=1 Tax=Schlesneria sp. TaxID=2762018 RepID=UPI002F0D032C